METFPAWLAVICISTAMPFLGDIDREGETVVDSSTSKTVIESVMSVVLPALSVALTVTE
jgi:predicted aconitase with swiveling domain